MAVYPLFVRLHFVVYRHVYFDKSVCRGWKKKLRNMSQTTQLQANFTVFKSKRLVTEQPKFMITGNIDLVRTSRRQLFCVPSASLMHQIQEIMAAKTPSSEPWHSRRYLTTHSPSIYCCVTKLNFRICSIEWNLCEFERTGEKSDLGQLRGTSSSIHLGWSRKSTKKTQVCPCLMRHSKLVLHKHVGDRCCYMKSARLTGMTSSVC
jgi:hypothetical protein